MMRITVTIIAVSAACVLIGCRKVETHEKALTPVRTQAVEMFTAADELRYSANVEPNTQVALAFKVGGYVDRLHRVRGIDGRERDVQEGDLVRAGTVLAQVRQADYAAKVSQAKSQSAEAQASLEAAKSQMAEAEAAYQQAQLDHSRAKNLFDTQSLTKAEYDGAKTKLDAGRARVEAARNQVAAIQSRMAGAQAMLAEAAIAFDDTALKAPLSGVVLKRMVETGSLVGPGSPAFVLADTSTVKVVFGIPDTLVPRVKLGLTLPVRTEALPDAEFSGPVTRISPSADPRSRVFDVEVSLPNSSNQLKTGMIASVTLKGPSGVKPTPVVPLTSIVRSKSKPDAYAVFVVREESGKQIACLRDVELGQAFGNTIAVTGGLELGQRVITNGSNLVADGEAVRVVP